MTSSLWADLCKQPTLPVSTEKYAKLVHDATIRLHQPIDSILSALNERVIGLTKLANFESALGDADVMQQLSPSSPVGYLCAATVYKEQGKQLQVIDHMKAAAIQQQNKRIDFITQLPIAILAATLSPMIVGESPLDAFQPCPYLHVSIAWRDYFLRYSNGLRFETGDKEEEEDLEKCSQLVRFAPHIKALHVRQYTKRSWLPELLYENDFCSLREFYIDGMEIGYMDRFISSLESIGSSLTHLSIPQDYEALVPVAKVLAACPNLVSLVMHAPDIGAFYHIPMTPWPNMTRLSLFSQADSLYPNDIIGICQRFPALRKFDLHSCADLESALIAPEYCPLLKSIELAFGDTTVDAYYSDHNTGSDEPAVTKISVNMDHCDDLDEFASMDLYRCFGAASCNTRGYRMGCFPSKRL